MVSLSRNTIKDDTFIRHQYHWKTFLTSFEISNVIVPEILHSMKNDYAGYHLISLTNHTDGGPGVVINVVRLSQRSL